MLFKKDIDPSCMYCKYGVRITDGNIACLRHGIVCAGDMCWRFSYDPLKRIPAKPRKIDVSKYTENDFSL